MKRSLLLFALILYPGPSCRSADPFTEPPPFAPPQRGAVVAAHPLAVATGLAVLDMGGNAADAAVATALALSVVYPQAGNLGGGGFALWVPHEGEPTSLDFRETTPAGYRSELYLDEAGEFVSERSVSTVLAVGVPGSPAGLFELYRRHGSGRLSFSRLCQPAIRLAEDGFAVDPWLARSIRVESIRARLEKDPAARALFYPDGEPLEEGTRLVQTALANTLERYARGGPPAFYRGPVAEAMVRALAERDLAEGGLTRGGSMNLDDLADYTVQVRRPLVGWFRGREVISMGPPSSGGLVLLQVLAMLDGFPLDAERERTLEAIAQGREPAGDGSGISARALHWWIEAMRRAFADRAQHLADPDHFPVPLAALLDPRWIASRRVSIGEQADPEVAAWVKPPPEGGGETTHVSVLDEDGNAVSLTTTLNTTFGSGILVPDGGFLLNNELDDFSIQAGVPNVYGLVGGYANRLQPGKRPLSSMTPTVIRDGGRRVTLVLGSPGGPRIITGVIQVLLRHLVYGQDPLQAVEAPRLHQQWKPSHTRFELGWESDLVDALGNRHGQECKVEPDASFASVQAIFVDPQGEPRGVSDPRRGGVAGVQDQPLPRPRHPDESRDMGPSLVPVDGR